MQKLKTELKNIQRSSHDIAMSKGTFFPENVFFLAKKMLTSAKQVLVLTRIFSETTYVCVPTQESFRFLA